MDVTRRELILLAAVAAGGCAQMPDDAPPIPSRRESVDAGPLAEYAAPGVYAKYRESHGFFIVHAGDKVYAQSAVCTHRRCKVKPAGDGFECPCHGAAFTLDGAVARGPAKRDLSRYSVEQDGRRHLIVYADQPALEREQFGAAGAFIAMR